MLNLIDTNHPPGTFILQVSPGPKVVTTSHLSILRYLSNFVGRSARFFDFRTSAGRCQVSGFEDTRRGRMMSPNALGLHGHIDYRYVNPPNTGVYKRNEFGTFRQPDQFTEFRQSLGSRPIAAQNFDKHPYAAALKSLALDAILHRFEIWLPSHLGGVLAF